MGKFTRSAVFLFLLLIGCVDPYSIKSVSYEPSLVVEGNITTEFKEHRVVLSRAAPIGQAQFIPETGAQVSLKVGSGFLNMQEISPGVYVTPPLAGVIGTAYSLHINTSNGQEVVSEEVVLRSTPDIKDIYATYSTDLRVGDKTGGIQILLDTEDPTGTTRYFRWEYEQTWEIQTPFESNFIWIGGNNVVFRSVPVSNCYASDSSNRVIINSTRGLAADKVVGQLIQTLPAEGPYLSVKYSILVRQRSLSETGYFYWQALEKTNQSQGTLYDTQPGTVQGNLSSVTGDGVVLGYFDASAVKEMRVFFSPRDFRDKGFVPLGFEDYCNFLTAAQVPQSGIGNFLSANPGLEIIGATGFGDPTLFLLPAACCDCTAIGTNIKPAFWQ